MSLIVDCYFYKPWGDWTRGFHKYLYFLWENVYDMGYNVIFWFLWLLFTWKTEIYFMEFIIKSSAFISATEI